MTQPFEHGGTVFAVARELGVEPEELLDFSASINPLGPPPAVWPAIEAAFRRVGHYPDSPCTELRTALAARHGLSPEQVAVGNGSTELIHLLPRLERFRRKRALLVAPTFAEYGHGLQLAGWHHDYLFLSPDDGFALDLHRVGQQLAAGYDLLFLCNPGNPTGRLYPRVEIIHLLRLCRDAGTCCVLDEAFMDFCEEESATAVLADHPGCLILRSLTKFYAFPGLRLGYVLAEGEIIAGLERLRPPWSVGTLAQAAGCAALADSAYAKRSRETVTACRQRLFAGLGSINGLRVYPGAANYLLVEILTGMTAARLRHQLLHRGMLIRDCANFAGLDGRFFRVAVHGEGDNNRLVGGVRDLLG
jgi:threonine-phosphate decarboxylase